MAKLGYDDNGNFVGLNNMMVRKALGANTLNVESLCQHPNINKWSHSKPFNRVIRSEHTLNGLEFARLMTEEDRIDSRYGLTYPPYSIEAIDSKTDSGVVTEYVRPELDMIGCLTEEQARKVLQYNYYTFDETGVNLKIDPDGQFYGKPYGGGKSYITYEDGKEVLHEHESICRLNDFDGYDHYSKNPFECVFKKVIDVDDNGYTTGAHFNLTIKTRRSIDNYGGLTVDNWCYRLDYPNHTPAGNGYLCVGVWSYDGQVLYGLLDATSEYDDDTAIINKHFMSLDSGNACHPTVGGYSTYEFVLTNDALNEIAVKGGLDVGLYAVIPFIVNDNIIYSREVNGTEYPLFAKGGLLKSSPYFLFAEDGVWHVKRLFFDRLRLFYNLPSDSYDPNHPQADAEYDENIEKTTAFFRAGDIANNEVVTYESATMNRQAGITSVDISTTVKQYFLSTINAHTGLVIKAGADLVNISPSKKRAITIGDYWTNDKLYFTATSRSSLSPSSSFFIGVPLCNISLKRKSDGFVTKGIIFATKDSIFLSFIPSDEDGTNYIDITLSATDMEGSQQTAIVSVPQEHTVKLFSNSIPTTNGAYRTIAFKSVTFVNEVQDSEIQYMKAFLRYFKSGYGWDTISESSDSEKDWIGITTPTQSEDSGTDGVYLQIFGDGGFQVLLRLEGNTRQETYIPYIDPTVIEGQDILSFANFTKDVSADIPIGLDENDEIIYETVTATYEYKPFDILTDVDTLCGIQVSMEDETDLKSDQYPQRPPILW